MYRVVIVDDEEPVLDSFSFIFKKYVSDFTLCGKARSGTEAVKVIREENPDLVFMDIQMPGIDGIEAIKQIQPLFPHIIFILATAYERFDIAQKAIHLGVFSYLVKPVSRNKILEELDKVKKHLDERIKEETLLREDEQFLEKTRFELQKKFLSGLIWKNPGEDQWNEFCRIFSVKAENAAVYLIGGLSSYTADLRKDLYGEIINKIQYKYNCLSAELGDKLIILFPEEHEMKNLEKQVRNKLAELDQYPFILGAGGMYHYSKLTVSFSEAFEPFSGSNTENTDISNHTEQSCLLSLYRAIITSDRERGESLFKDYWIGKFKTDSFIVAKGRMVALFTLLLQDIDSHILITSKFDLDPAEEIMQIKSMENWETWAAKSIKNLFDLLEVQKNYSYPKPLKKALSYIAENYANQLQLSSVADECMVTGSYLSRLFSEHMNTKFIDYINRYRVNQAVILLKDKNVTIKEASFMVGYQDPNYFSRIFRKIMGVSPSDFEKRGTL